MRRSRHREGRHCVRDTELVSGGAHMPSFLNSAGRVHEQPGALPGVGEALHSELVRDADSLHEFLFHLSVDEQRLTPFLSIVPLQVTQGGNSARGSFRVWPAVPHAQPLCSPSRRGESLSAQGFPGLLQRALPRLAFPSHLPAAQSFVVFRDHPLS